MGKGKIRLFPYLYLIAFIVFQYSANDMATSTNAYQAQGNRTVVYIYLVLSILLMTVYILYKGKLHIISPLGVMLAITIWIAVDNLVIGNLLGGSMWTCVTHIGLSFWWILAFNFGYMFCQDDPQKETQLKAFLLIMLFYYIYQFIDVAITSNQEYEETTVLNLVYRIVVFVPFIWLLKRKWLKNTLLFIIFITTIVSMKRGAIIVLPIMLLAAAWGDGKKTSIRFSSIIKGVLVCLIAVAAIVIADNITGGFLSFRFSPEELKYGSSRSEKYAFAISEISSRDFWDFLVGIGSIKKSGVHNEFLEFFYTFGLVGVILYIAFLAVMLLRMLNLRKAKSEYAGIYCMIYAFILVVGIYSGVYFSHSTFYIMLTLGMVERRISEEQICVKRLE